MSPIATWGEGALPDLAARIVSFALRPDAAFRDVLEARAAIDGLFREMEEAALGRRIPSQEIKEATYALAALLDERVRSLAPEIREVWAGSSFETRRFGSTNATEEFFARIERMRAMRDQAYLGALEVYLVCLAFGFEGKHRGPQGALDRKKIAATLGREVAARREGRAEASPFRFDVPGRLPPAPRSRPILLVPAILALLVAGLYLFYWVGLEARADALSEDVREDSARAAERGAGP